MDQDKPKRERRHATRKGPERPYIDPTPDDEDDPVVDAKSQSAHDDWLRQQKPPHHG